MKEPTDEEINKTLAEFKYPNSKIEVFKSIIKVDGLTISNLYTESLDALVPVVERLFTNYKHEFISYCKKGLWEVDFHFRGMDCIKTFKNKSPSRALALACYYVIKEMEG